MNVPPELLLGVGGLVGGFLLGRATRTRDLTRKREKGSELSFYLKGIMALLAGDRKRALEDFSEALKLNSDLVEGYMAMGSLLRDAGDATRAIRIHRGITCRQDIDKEMMVEALNELALDYKAAGLLEKAVETCQELVRLAPKRVQAWVELREVSEELGLWERALEAQERISRLTSEEASNVKAHILTEMGKAHRDRGDMKGARWAFKKAISTYKGCVDAYLQLGDLYASDGSDSKAVEVWLRILDEAPQFTFLVFDRLEHAYYRMGKVSALEGILRERCGDDPFSRFHLARFLRKKGEAREAARLLEVLVQAHPLWVEARRELVEAYKDQGLYQEALEVCQRSQVTENISRQGYECSHCGRVLEELHWRCPRCRRWDTVKMRWGPWNRGGEEK